MYVFRNNKQKLRVDRLFLLPFFSSPSLSLSLLGNLGDEKISFFSGLNQQKFF